MGVIWVAVESNWSLHVIDRSVRFIIHVSLIPFLPAQQEVQTLWASSRPQFCFLKDNRFNIAASNKDRPDSSKFRYPSTQRELREKSTRQFIISIHLKRLSVSLKLSIAISTARLSHIERLGHKTPPRDPRKRRIIKDSRSTVRRCCRWSGCWAPTGWWSPRSSRSPRTGPCWTPASGPRSSLQIKNPHSSALQPCTNPPKLNFLN